VNITNIQVTT